FAGSTPRPGSGNQAGRRVVSVATRRGVSIVGNCTFTPVAAEAAGSGSGTSGEGRGDGRVVGHDPRLDDEGAGREAGPAVERRDRAVEPTELRRGRPERRGGLDREQDVGPPEAGVEQRLEGGDLEAFGGQAV